MDESVYFSEMPSPVGSLLLTRTGEGLTGVLFDVARRATATGAEWIRDDRALCDVRDQLEGYFQGRRKEFDLPLVMKGSPFQVRVWNELRKIPFGATASYGDIARRIGMPGAARAVGLANGSNRIAIIVPCHRVIASDGSLAGYGGGRDRKQWLLNLENAHPLQLPISLRPHPTSG